MCSCVVVLSEPVINEYLGLLCFGEPFVVEDSPTVRRQSFPER